VSKPKIFERQVAAVICQAASKASDREGLAGRSSDKKVNWFMLIRCDCGEVTEVANVRIVMRENGARKLVDLSEERRTPTERMPCHGSCLYA
jgi:hypothetical protein